jgi:hypothetical protein
MTTRIIAIAMPVLVLPMVLTAQLQRDVAAPSHWAAPLYWQPNEAETRAKTNWAASQAAAESTPSAQTKSNPLVFVAMTPCRIVDTRFGQGFNGIFGPPTMAEGSIRTFPIQSSPNCAIPAAAQAYSFNVTVVPLGFLGYLTVYPSGQARPTTSTINDSQGIVLANAAIVAAGSNGAVDVFANNATDVILDINGYYINNVGTAVTLAQGTAGAPSLNFTGDTGTGIFSSGIGALNFATGGVNRLTLRPDGDLELPGSIRKNGTLFFHNLGNLNTGAGLSALAAIDVNSPSTAFENTATGAFALSNNAIAGANTANGAYALLSNTNGSANTAVGDTAMYKNIVGHRNTAIGASALFYNYIGANNTASGMGALEHNVNGSDNTANGYVALVDATGSKNTALGSQAGFNLTNGSNNIMIGNQGVAADDSVIRIGDIQTKVFVAGISGVTTGGAAIPVVIDSNGQLGTVSSSRRFKEDIADMGQASSDLSRLRPVTYRYKKPYADGSKPLDYGLIAEEVAEIYPDLVVKSKDGQIETVQYQKLTPMLLNEIQKQSETIRSLESRLAALEALLSNSVR